MLLILHGDEEFTRSEEVARLKADAQQNGMGNLNTVVLDGRKLSLDELINTCNTTPFLSEHRLVIVQDLLQRFEAGGRTKEVGEGQAKSAQDDMARLLAYLPQLPASTLLVLVESKALKGNSPVLKAAQRWQDCRVREFAPFSRGELQDWIQRRAKQKGAEITHEAVTVLATFVGQDLRQLDQELAKLAAWAGYTRPITQEDVTALVSASEEGDIFDLVDTLGLRNREAALRKLHALIADKANELYLLTMIARQIRLLLSVKDLTERRLRQDQIGSELGLKPFVVDKLLRQSRQFSLQELEVIQRRILEIDQALKTGRIEGQLALELLVLEICHPPREATPSRTRA